jgi:hypothetical protein
VLAILVSRHQVSRHQQASIRCESVHMAINQVVEVSKTLRGGVRLGIFEAGQSPRSVCSVLSPCSRLFLLVACGLLFFFSIRGRSIHLQKSKCHS